ncbi:MAG: OB-fold domain-containing protein [Candidatus Binatia bacterium]
MEKPFPIPTPTSKPFWDALAAHRVRIQQCRACHGWIFYPRIVCPRCWGADLEWKDIAGTGTLYTFTIGRKPTHPLFADEVPQRLAVVQLDEGPRLTTTLVNVQESDIRVGMRLKPFFDDIAARNVTLLRYQPAGRGEKS